MPTPRHRAGGPEDTDSPDFDPRPPSLRDRSPDDARDQRTPGSRQPTPTRPRDRTETVRADTTLDWSDGGLVREAVRSGQLDREEVSGTADDVSRARSFDSFRTGDVQRSDVGSDDGFTAEVRDRVERSEQPGTTARGIDRATDGFRDTRPATAAGLSTLATSFRTEGGIPIGDTGARLPGASDFERFRAGLEPARQSIDDAIEAGVGRVTPDPGRAPFDLGDIPVTDPATLAVGATLGTEPGQRGAQRGITTGLQAFNPAAITQDVATFTEFGVRGSDRLLDADDEELQEAFDVGAAVGETAREVGPTLGAAAVASDPSRLFSVPATAVTIGAAGVAGPSAALGAGRAGRRAASEAIDGESVARFAADDRGQLDFGTIGRRRGDDSDDSTGIMSEIADELDRFERATAVRTGRERAERRTIDEALDAGRRQEPGSEPVSVSRPETQTVSRPEFRTASPRPSRSGPTAAQQNIGRRTTIDDGLSPRESQLAAQLGRETPETDLRVFDQLPRDPLDTSGTPAFRQAERLDVGIGAAEQPGLGLGTAGLGGMLGEQARQEAQTGVFAEGDTDSLFGPDVGAGERGELDIGPTEDVDTTPDVGIGPGEDTASAADTRTATAEMLRGMTMLGSRVAAAPAGESPTAGFGDIDTPTTADPTTRGPRTPRTPSPPGTPRTPRIPSFGADADDDDEFEAAFDADDDLFDTGILDASEAFEQEFDESAFRL